MSETVRPRLDLAASRPFQPDLTARPLRRVDRPFVVVEATTPVRSAVQLRSGPIGAGQGTTEFPEEWTSSWSGRETRLDVRVAVSDWAGAHSADVGRVEWRVLASDLQRLPSRRTMAAALSGARPRPTEVGATSNRPITSRRVSSTTTTDAPLAQGSAAWGAFFSVDLGNVLGDVASATLTVEAELVSPDGQPLSLATTATYTYRWAKETSSGPITVAAPPPVPKNPRVQVDAQVVGFTAFRPQPNVITRWIIVNKIDNPELEAVLDYLDVSTAIGTRFALNLAEIPYILEKLDWTDKVTLTATKMWNHIAQGVNWATGTFQSIASAISGELFAGSANGTAFVEAMMGALPGSPLAGDFNTLLNQGEDYVKTLLRSEVAKRNGGEPPSEAEQNQIDEQTTAVFDALRHAAQDPQDSARFLIPDPDGLGRAGTAYLRLTHSGLDDPAPGAFGGERDVQVRVVYRGGVTPHAPQGLGHQLDLFSRSFPVPSAVLGTSYVVPVPLDNHGGGYVDSDWNEAVNGVDGAVFVIDNRDQTTQTARGDWGSRT